MPHSGCSDLHGVNLNLKKILYILSVKGSGFLNLDEKLFQFRSLPI